MSKEGKWVMGVLMVFLVTVGFVSPAAAGIAPTPENWAPLVAKIIMGLSLSLGLAGSAVGLSISFSVLLGGGPDNYYKNIVLAMMPSMQGLYSIVVFFIDLNRSNTDPYNVAGRAGIFGICMFLCGWYQGVVSAAGIRGILERKNTMVNGLVSSAIPQNYAVFALVMTFIMK
jgi:F0F1-type ATP synthase membrane subunit c/vacuolar-type H+-ATPase subunit K